MNALSIGQILFYAVFLIVAGYPLGMYMARIYMNDGRDRDPLAGVSRARLLPGHPHRREARAGLEVLREVGGHLQHRLLRSRLRHLQAPGTSVPESGPSSRCRVAHLAEHHRELRHEHELAVLRRRVHDVVPQPDGDPRRPAVRLGRGRDGRARRRHPRPVAQVDERARQLLARPLPVSRVHPPASVTDPRDRAHLAGRPADVLAAQPRRRRSRARTRRSHAARWPR